MAFLPAIRFTIKGLKINSDSFPQMLASIIPPYYVCPAFGNYCDRL
jgi:hypothetical protein